MEVTIIQLIFSSIWEIDKQFLLFPIPLSILFHLDLERIFVYALKNSWSSYSLKYEDLDDNNSMWNLRFRLFSFRNSLISNSLSGRCLRWICFPMIWIGISCSEHITINESAIIYIYAFFFIFPIEYARNVLEVNI